MDAPWLGQWSKTTGSIAGRFGSDAAVAAKSNGSDGFKHSQVPVGMAIFFVGVHSQYYPLGYVRCQK